MIKVVLASSLLVAVALGFPQGPPAALPPGPPGGAPPNGPPPPPPPCLPPPPPGVDPASLPPPPKGPDGQPLPICPPTLVSGHCGGKTYYWDTVKDGQEGPEDFKKCFFGEGAVGAVCNGKEYSWEPSKESKPKELEECEKEFAAKNNAPR